MQNLNSAAACPYHGHVITQSAPPSENGLISLNQISDLLPPDLVIHKTELLKFKSWVLEFLCKPNSELGRKGAVCPFTKKAYDLNFFWVTVQNSWQISPENLISTFYRYKNIFKSLAPNAEGENIFKTISILFPFIDKNQFKIIEEVQESLKPAFVKEGIMIGQFYPGCSQPGLNNSAFRPLNAPLPLLAIRNMVESDLPFLVGNPEFEKSYHTRFQKENV